MTYEAGLVDLDLVEPRKLLPSVEDLHRYLVPFVDTLPHLSEATFSDQTIECDLSGNRALDQQWKSGTATRIFEKIVETRFAIGTRIDGKGRRTETRTFSGVWKMPGKAVENENYDYYGEYD